MAPSARVKVAGGPVAVDISDMLPGAVRTAEWRGKPNWLVRRSLAMLAPQSGVRA